MLNQICWNELLKFNYKILFNTDNPLLSSCIKVNKRFLTLSSHICMIHSRRIQSALIDCQLILVSVLLRSNIFLFGEIPFNWRQLRDIKWNECKSPVLFSLKNSIVFFWIYVLSHYQIWLVIYSCSYFKILLQVYLSSANINKHWCIYRAVMFVVNMFPDEVIEVISDVEFV